VDGLKISDDKFSDENGRDQGYKNRSAKEGENNGDKRRDEP